jgi:hypothetical protein
MEIVGGEPQLMFGSDDEAVAKITSTLDDPSQQHRLRHVLAATSDQFSTAHFMQHVRDIVTEFQP